MLWVVSVFVAVGLVETCLRALDGSMWHLGLRNVLGNFSAFQNAKNDDERQRLLLQGGFDLLKLSVAFFGFVFVLIGLAYLAPWLLDWNADQQYKYVWVTSVLALLWWIGRAWFNSRIRSGTTVQSKVYSRLDRWLHWLALNPLIVRQLSFELDRLFALPQQGKQTSSVKHARGAADAPVYVCGLARSGTTMLLQLLGQAENFRSLSYRDMPFVLAPNLWRLLNRVAPREATLVERAHGDGVLVDFDSPEAFEEVFWRTFGNIANDGADCYGSEAISDEALRAFSDYRVMVANPRLERQYTVGRWRRYLSKNNNNLLRLRSLSSDPTATVLLVYRDPVVTARSLHRLHLRFCADVGDCFTQDYMRWLGHHEFGPGHLPFCFAKPRMNPTLSPNNPDYWLDYWNVVYQYILEQVDLRLNLINYDVLCQSPQRGLEAIFAILAVHADTSAMASQVRLPSRQTKPPVEFSPDLLSAAMATHSQLVVSAANVFR